MAFLRSMSELFERCALGTGEAGIVLREHQPLAELVDGIGPEFVIALSPTGEKVPLDEVFAQIRGREMVIIIGGFPEGDYRSPVYEMADRSISLGEELLTVPDVTAQLLAALSRWDRSEGE
jgi:rRNA small subunit pseudouridine methyltransferase Nep1